MCCNDSCCDHCHAFLLIKSLHSRTRQRTRFQCPDKTNKFILLWEKFYIRIYGTSSYCKIWSCFGKFCIFVPYVCSCTSCSLQLGCGGGASTPRLGAPGSIPGLRLRFTNNQAEQNKKHSKINFHVMRM